MTSGAVVGMLLGVGLLLIWSSFWVPDARKGERRPGRLRRGLEEDLSRVGLGSVPAVAVPLIGLGLAVVVGAAFAVLSGSTVLALALAAATSVLPFVVLRSMAHRRREQLREIWPEAVDHINSAVRAGLSLPEALVQVGEKGPEALRPPFAEFALDFQASGDFSSSLDRLKDRLADPVGDRIIEALRITRDVGGTDLGVLLRTLSAFLREEARTRAELEARQSWTINASRLALAAPWIVLALMATRPQAAEAYDTAAGFMLIIAGAVISVVAYRVMLRIARLPVDERVLR